MYDRYDQLRKEKNLSHKAVSEATGIPASTFSDWKKGKSHPKADKIDKLAKYFGVNSDWIRGKSEFRTFSEKWASRVSLEELNAVKKSLDYHDEIMSYMINNKEDLNEYIRAYYGDCILSIVLKASQLTDEDQARIEERITVLLEVSGNENK